MTEIKEKVKAKLEKGKEWAKQKKDSVVEFCKENPQLILPLMSGFGMIASGLLASGSKRSSKHEEHCRVKDDVTEQDFLTNHPLTNTEILELGERMIDGQSKGEALNEMGVLRKEKKRK